MPVFLKRPVPARASAYVVLSVLLLLMELTWYLTLDAPFNTSGLPFAIAFALVTALSGFSPAWAGAGFFVVALADATAWSNVTFSVLGFYVIMMEWMVRRWYWQAGLAVVAFYAYLGGFYLLQPLRVIPRSGYAGDIMFIGLFLVPAAALGGALIRRGEAKAAALRADVEKAKAQAVESEKRVRSALADSVHDTVARDLARIVVTADQGLAERGSSDLQDRLATVLGIAQDSLGRLRTLIHSAADPSIADVPTPTALSLGDALDLCAEILKANGTSLEVRVPLELDEVLSPPTAGFLSLAIQECSINALKHGASRGTARLLLECFGDEASLQFSSSLSSQNEGRNELSGGHGLRSLQARAHALGGKLTYGAVKNAWVVVAELPSGGDSLTLGADQPS